MKKTSLFAGLAFLLSVCAVAQEEVPKGEVYLGYSYMRIAPTTQVNAYNSNGGLGQVQYNINKHVGILADLGGFANGNISVRGSGNLPQNQTQFQYLFGPRIFTNKTGKISPFAEFEVGGIHNSRSFNVPTAIIPFGFVPLRGSGITLAPSGPGLTKIRSTQNGFALAVGGGIDIKVKRSIAVRPIQLDYLPAKFSPFNVTTALSLGRNNTRWSNNLRYSGGVDFRFGGGSQ